MAALSNSRTIGRTFSNQVSVEHVEYDFAVDGGATGALDIFTANADLVVLGFITVVKTAATSGGSATLKVGVTGDDDRFLTTTQGAVANLTANAVLLPVVVEGTPNVTATPYKLAAGEKILQTIGTAPLTAGKVSYKVIYIKA